MRTPTTATSEAPNDASAEDCGNSENLVERQDSLDRPAFEDMSIDIFAEHRTNREQRSQEEVSTIMVLL
jgi:hypothetical protein